MVHPRKLMHPYGFLVPLGEFLIVVVGDCVEALVDFHNGEMVRVLEPVTPLEWSQTSPLIY